MNSVLGRILHRLKTGFGMARRSGHVLTAHPKLLVFPIVGALSGVAFLLTLFGGVYITESYGQEYPVVLFGALFVAYFVETFIASFFTAGLVAATRSVFRGEKLSVRAALRTAWERKLSLLIWSMIAAVVSVILRPSDTEDSLTGQIIIAIVGISWTIMTFFIVPVIVFQNPSVTAMFKESTSMFRNTWGETVGSMAAIDIVTAVLSVAAVALGLLTYVLTDGLGAVQPLVSVLVGASALLFALLLGKALSGIAKTALYVYATERTAPEYFDDMDFGKLQQ